MANAGIESKGTTNIHQPQRKNNGDHNHLCSTNLKFLLKLDHQPKHNLNIHDYIWNRKKEKEKKDEMTVGTIILAKC